MHLIWNPKKSIKIRNIMIRLHKNSGRSHGKLKILNSGGGHKLIYKYINF